jgi:hypothetical protein
MPEETLELEETDHSSVITKDLVMETVAKTLITAVTMFAANVALNRVAKIVENRRAAKAEDPS